MQRSYRLYLQELFDYLDSIVIKFDPFAKALNDLPAYQHLTDVDPDDQTTWPYYRILVGDHTLASEPIYVWSPNAQAEFPLTRANVELWPDIVTFYINQNSNNLRELLERYPNDQFLIRRILNPVVDIQQAIAAPNLSLLDTLRNERALPGYEQADLRSFLSEFLTQFEYRWYINVFEYEDLYPTTFWSMLWYVLPLALSVKRILNVRTHQVHSYHVWEYLGSVGYGSYRGYLSRYQELFLYFNNDYLKFNVGKRKTLAILEDVFLRPIKYSLTEKVLTHHTQGCETNANKIPEVLNKDPRSNRVDYEKSLDLKLFLLELHRQKYDSRGDNTYLDQVVTTASNVPTNQLQTKFLELIRNIEGNELMMLVRFVMDSIACLVANHRLPYQPVFTSHITGAAIAFDTVVDALDLFYYLIYQQHSLVPVATPTKYVSVSAVQPFLPPAVPSNFNINAVPYHPHMYVDVDEFRSSVPYTEGVVHDGTELSNQLGEQFTWLFEKVAELRGTTDEVVYEIKHQLYRSVVPEQKVYDLPQTLTTYGDYFVKYPEVKELTEQLNTVDDYRQTMNLVLESICPLTHGFKALAESEENASVLINKLMDLFTYLISYNVTLVGPIFDTYDEYVLPHLAAHFTSESYVTNDAAASSDVGEGHYYTITQTSAARRDLAVAMSEDLELTDHHTFRPIDTVPLDMSSDLLAGATATWTIRIDHNGPIASFDGPIT